MHAHEILLVFSFFIYALTAPFVVAGSLLPVAWLVQAAPARILLLLLLLFEVARLQMRVCLNRNGCCT